MNVYHLPVSLSYWCQGQNKTKEQESQKRFRLNQQQFNLFIVIFWGRHLCGKSALSLQVIFNEIDALFLQLNQNAMTDCHLVQIFCVWNCKRYDLIFKMCWQSVVAFWFNWRNNVSITSKVTWLWSKLTWIERYLKKLILKWIFSTLHCTVLLKDLVWIFPKSLY